jgi:hypothetical protein
MADEPKYEGFSLKSSKKSNNITVKNPLIDMGGTLDHVTRKLNTRTISSEGLSKAQTKTAKAMKIKGDISTGPKRKSIINGYREREGVTSNSSIEHEANKHAYEVKGHVAGEFHEHLNHLLTNTGSDGHKMIRNMLLHHLTPETSFPVSKVYAKGDHPDKVSAKVESLDTSPVKKLLQSRSPRFVATRNGHTVTIHHDDGKGNLVALAHYRPKTKGNAFEHSIHGWNVIPATRH